MQVFIFCYMKFYHVYHEINRVSKTIKLEYPNIDNVSCEKKYFHDPKVPCRVMKFRKLFQN
jgi:hypothetical protein